MKNLPKYIDSICWAFSNALPGQPWSPKTIDGSLITYCNYGFNFICNTMNYKGLGTVDSPLMANWMYDHMNDPNGDWLRIEDPRVIQYHANQGILCGAVYKNIEMHGHVCTVMPGELEYSNSWGTGAPKVMNIGKDVFIGKKACFAFTKDQMPRYFALKSML